MHVTDGDSFQYLLTGDDTLRKNQSSASNEIDVPSTERGMHLFSAHPRPASFRSIRMDGLYDVSIV
jgi:hypothetical protein